MKANQDALKQEADLSKILDDAFIKSEKKTASREDGDQLSQKELVDIMSNAVGRAIEANSKLLLQEVANKIKETDSGVVEIKSVLTDLLAGLSVNQARTQFPDFDKYSEPASRILQSTKGLSPQQAYLLAKAQAASTQPDPEKVSSERPTGAPASISSNREIVSRQNDESEVSSSSRKIFQDAVSAAIDKRLTSRQG